MNLPKSVFGSVCRRLFVHVNRPGACDYRAPTEPRPKLHYYEHHIGDYAEATAHLSFVEDAALSRLLRKCYATERPLPRELAHVQRLAGARTDDERQAVEVVLHEFFTLAEDGWHNLRCDTEIARYREKQTERQAERDNAAQRQQRARERRSAMFEQLRALGEVPPWTTSTQELEAHLSRVTHANPSHPVTRDNTANQEPGTKNQEPLTSNHKPVTSIKYENTPRAHEAAPPESQPGTRAGHICRIMKDAGLQAVNPGHSVLLALIDSGASDEEFLGAARSAAQQGKGFAYALGALKGQRADAALLRGVLHQGPILNRQEALEASNRSVAERYIAKRRAERAAEAERSDQ